MAGLLLPGSAAEEVEPLILRHQPAVLQRHSGRLQLEPGDRLLLAPMSRLLSRECWGSFFVTPATPLRWLRELIASRWTCPHKRPGRPPIPHETGESILRLARENLLSGHRRVHGELTRSGITAATTVRAKLRQGNVPRAYQCARNVWGPFPRAQASSTGTAPPIAPPTTTPDLGDRPDSPCNPAPTVSAVPDYSAAPSIEYRAA